MSPKGSEKCKNVSSSYSRLHRNENAFGRRDLVRDSWIAWQRESHLEGAGQTIKASAIERSYLVQVLDSLVENGIAIEPDSAVVKYSSEEFSNHFHA